MATVFWVSSVEALEKKNQAYVMVTDVGVDTFTVDA